MVINIGYLQRYFRIPVVYYIISLVLFISVLLIVKRLSLLRRISLGLLISYTFLVVTVTIFIREPTESVTYVLEPFAFFSQYFTDEFTHFEIEANALLFFPIGLLLPAVINKPVWLPLLVGFLSSVSIEFAQLVFHRGMCETDDVISNCIGLTIGFLVYWLLRALCKIIKLLLKKRNHFCKENND